MTLMRSPFVVTMMVAALFPLGAGAQRNRDRDRDRQREDAQDVRTGVVDLTQVSGDVIVTAWDRGEARIRAYAERGDIRSTLSSSRLTLEIESVRGRVGDSRFEVFVPAGVRVLARSTSGDVTVKGTKGPVDARSTS